MISFFTSLPNAIVVPLVICSIGAMALLCASAIHAMLDRSCKARTYRDAGMAIIISWALFLLMLL